MTGVVTVEESIDHGRDGSRRLVFIGTVVIEGV